MVPLGFHKPQLTPCPLPVQSNYLSPRLAACAASQKAKPNGSSGPLLLAHVLARCGKGK